MRGDGESGVGERGDGEREDGMGGDGVENHAFNSGAADVRNTVEAGTD